MVLYLELMLHVPLFQEANPAMIRDLITFLQDVIVLPGDFVVRVDEEGDSMYLPAGVILAQGLLELVLETSVLTVMEFHY